MATVAPRLALTVVWSTAVYAMYTYLGGGLISLGYSTEEIAEVIVLYGCGAISGVLIGGRMTDRLGAQLTSTIGLAGLCLCFLLLRLALDAGVFAHSAGAARGFPDLRVVDAADQQIPYIVERTSEPLALDVAVEKLTTLPQALRPAFHQRSPIARLRPVSVRHWWSFRSPQAC